MILERSGERTRLAKWQESSKPRIEGLRVLVLPECRTATLRTLSHVVN